jgi:hypothetical protein
MMTDAVRTGRASTRVKGFRVMGHTIWVDAESDPNHQDTSVLIRMEEALDRLAGELQVPPLTGFYDYSELESAYSDLVEDETPPVEQWFDPKDALPTVRAICTHMTDHPDAFDYSQEFQDYGRDRHGRLMEGLRHVESELERLAARGTRFRLLVVP